MNDENKAEEEKPTLVELMEEIESEIVRQGDIRIVRHEPSEPKPRDSYTSREKRLDMYHNAWDLVQMQAEEDGLWFDSENIEVNMLQQALRDLHRVIEGKE